MIFIGIDPGQTGAVAWIQSGEIVGNFGVIDAPILTVEKNKSIRHEMDRVGMARIVEDIKSLVAPMSRIVAAVERVHSMPEQGVASSFSFGMGYGIWLGILAAFEIPVDLVHPTRWKKVMMDGMGKEKQASMVRAKELFPTAELSLKKHHGRADALLIAEYRRRLG